MVSEKIKTSGAKYLIITLVVIFIFSSVSVLFMNNKYNIISGEGKTLHINEFIRILNKEKQQLYSTKLDASEIAYLNSREFMMTILHRTLYSKLLELEMEAAVIKEPREIALESILKTEPFQTDGKFDVAKFNEFLKKGKLTEIDFVAMVQETDNKRFLMENLTGMVAFERTGVEVLLQQNNTYKNVKIFSIEEVRLESDSTAVSKEDVKRYYNNNIRKFAVPETRKIDYVRLINYDKVQLSNLRKAMSVKKNINDLAKAVNLKVETFGYLSRQEILNEEKYIKLYGLFEREPHKLYGVEKEDGDAYVYYISDIKEEYVKNIEKVEKDIISAIQDERTLELRKKIISEYVTEYKNKKSSDEVLTKRGFKVKRVNQLGWRKKQDQSTGFVKQVMATSDGNATDIFHDKSTVYFAIVTKTGIFDEKDSSYMNRDRILNEIGQQMRETLVSSYLNYLKDYKHNKIKVNYDLLDLIR
ncbi:hypothetical protein FACS1894152_3380 [Bacilli bacterium]|nr:hypothetical protein FACS1894152_3380 [Bacilli bacterium]